MAKYLEIENTKAKLKFIKENFTNRNFFTAQDAATELYNETLQAFNSKTVTEIYLETVFTVMTDMIHAYNYSNVDVNQFKRNIDHCSRKTNSAQITEHDSVKSSKKSKKK